MPLWIPFATAAFGAAVTISVFILTGRRERAKSKREAIAKFRSAFAEAITQIDNKDPHFLMSQAQVQHDVAIFEFRAFVDPRRVNYFDEAVEKFHRCRGEMRPALFTVLESSVSGKPIDNSDTLKLKEALNELLAFATKT